MDKVLLLDGYVDEPTCLGVPPYLSPYPRYIAGALWDYDPHLTLQYLTIDQLRNYTVPKQTLASASLIIVIAGMVVPGRYLSGYPASPNELRSLLESVEKPIKILCGPAARYGFGLSGGKHVRSTTGVKSVFDLIVTGDPELVVSDLLHNHGNIDNVDPARCRDTPSQIKNFAIKGAQIVGQHPLYPQYLITEIETYRGCPRSITGGCSFCSEPLKGLPQFREPSDIHEEIKALYANGIRHIRLGNQPCIFSYQATGVGDLEFPRPNPTALEHLFHGIRVVAPALQTLHIDNANPGVLAHYPKECEHIAKTIIKYHTPGDVAAFGVESVDPEVMKANNLKGSAEDMYSAIALLNKVGAQRGTNGLPELLPGLNFVFGLKGETKQTYELNYAFLQRLVHERLLLRRINLRQVLPIPGTPMFSLGTKIMKKHKHEFHHFKYKVRHTIEQPLLQRLVPIQTVLTGVYTEMHKGKLTFGRQLGSYPLLIGIPGVFPLHSFVNVAVVDYGFRSITAVPFPLPINTASPETIEALPGVGRKRALRLLSQRPFTTKEQIKTALDDPRVADYILSFIKVQ